MNWFFLVEVLLGRAPGFSAAEVMRLRLFVLAIVMLPTYGLWCAMAWLFAAPAPVTVRGSLSYQGSLVEQGEVEFAPAPGEKAQRHSILVEQGKFLLPASQGLLRNKKYVVRAKAYRKTGRLYKNAPGGEPSEEYEQYLPARYNSESELTFVADRALAAKGLDLDFQ